MKSFGNSPDKYFGWLKAEKDEVVGRRVRGGAERKSWVEWEDMMMVGKIVVCCGGSWSSENMIEREREEQDRKGVPKRFLLGERYHPHPREIRNWGQYCPFPLFRVGGRFKFRKMFGHIILHTYGGDLLKRECII